MSPPLRASPLKKGVSTSPAQSVLATPHQAGGSKTLAGEPLRPQDFRHTLYNLIHSRITSQGRHTLHSLNSKLILALSARTHTQSVYKSMDEQLSTWMDWMWSSRCLALLCTSTQSSNLKRVSEGSINSPRHSKRRWLTATEKVSVGWTDAIFFRASVHLVPLPRHLVVEVLWQNYSDAMLWRTVGSSGAEDPAARSLLLASTWPSDEPLLTRRFIRCYCIDLGASLSCLNSTTEKTDGSL
jgi:hypothetical protein